MKWIQLVAAILCATVTGSANAQGIWAQHSVAGPSARFGHAMVFDSARGEVVLFGGDNTSDTWGWNGSAWTLRSQVGPSPRSEHAMSFDSVRGRVVLFGGMTSTGEVGDTWEWDGTTWIPMLFATGPTPRAMHAMTYAGNLQRSVLFGGRIGTTDLDDTWTWNGNNWAQVVGASPPPRSAHSMHYDSQTQLAVATGGHQRMAQSGFYWSTIGVLNWISVPYSYTWESTFQDCWAFNGASWSMTTPLGEPRHASVATYDSLRRIAVIQGGMDSRAVFVQGTPGVQYQQAGTPTTLTQNPTTLPSTDASWGHTANWVRLSSAGPQLRDHAAAFDSLRNETVMFGGRDPSGAPQGTTWTWQGSPGTGISYGNGCGTPPLTLAQDTNNHPTIGRTASLDIGNNPTVLTYVLIGFSRTNFGTFSLPLPLGGYGLTGCLLHQSSEIGSIALNPTTPGSARFNLALPNWSGLINLRLFVQAWAHAPGQNPGNTIASNGVEWTIRF